MVHPDQDYMSWYPEKGEMVLVTVIDAGYDKMPGIVLGTHDKFSNLFKTLVGGRHLYIHYYEMIPMWLESVKY